MQPHQSYNNSSQKLKKKHPDRYRNSSGQLNKFSPIKELLKVKASCISSCILDPLKICYSNLKIPIRHGSVRYFMIPMNNHRSSGSSIMYLIIIRSDCIRKKKISSRVLFGLSYDSVLAIIIKLIFLKTYKQLQFVPGTLVSHILQAGYHQISGNDYKKRRSEFNGHPHG